MTTEADWERPVDVEDFDPYEEDRNIDRYNASILEAHGYDSSIPLLDLYLTNRDKNVIVLINGCYGGFGLNDEFRAEYQRLCGDSSVVSSVTNEGPYTTAVARSDPVLVDLIGQDHLEQRSCSCLVRESIPLFLLKHAKITDYDGCEGIDLNTQSFCMDLMTDTCDRAMNNSQLSDSEKLDVMCEARDIVRQLAGW